MDQNITGHNNLAYFQSKLNPEIDPTSRLSMHLLMTDCKATTVIQIEIMKNKIPLLDMTW